jgi:hypothetical protein
MAEAETGVRYFRRNALAGAERQEAALPPALFDHP